ncbi:MAG: universal stress protein [Planctomycetes bacterium]|nr:universal stress protein [Planctomycetota bacterium]
MNSAADFHHILAGMDDGGLADPALVAAVELGAALDIPVKLLHARPEPPHDHASPTELARHRAALLERVRREQLAHLAKAFARHGHTASESLLTVQLGDPAEQLVAQAGANAPALVVLGPHRDRGLFDLGGTTRAVLDAAVAPVWVQAGPFAMIRRVLVAVDLVAEGARVVAFASTLATRLGASLACVHAYEPPTLADPADDPSGAIADDRRDAARELADLLAEVELPPGSSIEVVDGAPADALLARQDSTDLMVLGSHGRSRIGELLLGSVAHAMLRAAAVPVVVLPRQLLGITAGSP